MNFRKFYLGLSSDERNEYAVAVGTTRGYIEAHLISIPPRKTPRKKLMSALSQESRGKVSKADILAHFFQ